MSTDSPPYRLRLPLPVPRWRKGQHGWELLVGKAPATPGAPDAPSGPDWVQASPAWIAAALSHALARDGGGWYALDRKEAFVGPGPWRLTVCGVALVAWRGEASRLVAAPEACPHMGASLAGGRVAEGKLVCAWHGLRLDERGFRDWRCHPMHDDGVLVWVRLPTLGETESDAPILPPRPGFGVAATIARELRCDPQDVIANRLDPWHGAHFHPHSFSALEVLERTPDAVRVRVTYRIAGPVGVEVDATFHCPEPRTIAMTIVDGEGKGTVVETHATPIAPGRTRLVETTIASSDRPGFGRLQRVPVLGRLLRPLLEARAERLWVDDSAYAERRYQLRMAAATPKLVPAEDAGAFRRAPERRPGR